MPFGQAALELIGEIQRAVIDRGVEAEMLDEQPAFLRPACDTHGAAAALLGDLAHRRTDRARGGSHHDRLPRLRLADLGQARIGRHARHAEDAEGGRDGPWRRIEPDQARSVGQRHRAPARRRQHQRARPTSRDGARPRPGTRPGLPSRRRERGAWRRTALRSFGPACRGRATATAPRGEPVRRPDRDRGVGRCRNRQAWARPRGGGAGGRRSREEGPW